MNLLILSHLVSDFKELTDITWTNNREYAARHGYDFHGHQGAYGSLDHDYQRIPLMHDILFNDMLGKHYDALWFIGADAMVINHTLRIEDVIRLDAQPDKHYFISKDINGANNDSVIVRNSPWSKTWLDYIASLEPLYRGDCWKSQRAVQHNMDDPKWRDGIRVVPHPAEDEAGGINSYFYSEYQWNSLTPGDVRKGHLLLHLPGMDLNQRLALFRSQRVADLMIK